MSLIAITSHGNGAGKTLLLEGIVRAWPGRFAAVKFTTVFRDGQFCPKDQQRQCACSRLHDEIEVITDPAVIEQPNTDTGRIAAAGARPVLWCLARPGAHARAWEHVRELLPLDRDVLTEGNTALLEIAFDAMLFVVNPLVPRKAWKENWRRLAERSDAIVVNEAQQALGRRRAASPEEAAASLAEVRATAPNAPCLFARLDAPLASWAAPSMDAILGTAGAPRGAHAGP